MEKDKQVEQILKECKEEQLLETYKGQSKYWREKYEALSRAYDDYTKYFDSVVFLEKTPSEVKWVTVQSRCEHDWFVQRTGNSKTCRKCKIWISLEQDT